MTISAEQDPPAFTLYYGAGSNRTLIGRVTRDGAAYVFTPAAGLQSLPVAIIKALGEWLEARNTP